MGFGIVCQQDARHVRLVGELDLATASHVLERLQPLTDEGGDIVVDLSELTFMDATGLQALATVARSLRGLGQLVLDRPSAQVRRLFTLCAPMLQDEPALVVEGDDESHSRRAPYEVG
ncbi:MAG: STAS domain-containing protein [Actinomycetota bacterium]